MTDPGSEPADEASLQNEPIVMTRQHYESFYGSYESPGGTPPDIDADTEDVPPPAAPGETDVWLTEWQVEEDRFDVAVEELVDWAVVPMDQDWLTRLFAGRRQVPLWRDTYADVMAEDPTSVVWTQLHGTVVRLDQVSVRFQQNPNDRRTNVAERGGAHQHSVRSLRQSRAHEGQIVGWIVRVACEPTPLSDR